jgi:hypothetical protein
VHAVEYDSSVPSANNMRLQRERIREESQRQASASVPLASFLLAVEEKGLVAWVDRGVLRAGRVLSDGTRMDDAEIDAIPLDALFEATGHFVIRP